MKKSYYIAKKILILLVIIISCTLTYAQDYNAFSYDMRSDATYTTQGFNNETVINPIIKRLNNGKSATVNTFSSFQDFNSAIQRNCTDTSLTLENFANGPDTITSCGKVIENSGGSCFTSQEIQPGIVITSSDLTAIKETTAMPAGQLQNTIPLVGAMNFNEYTIVKFDPPVYASAFEVFVFGAPDKTLTIRVLGDNNNLLDTFTVNYPFYTQVFIGFYSNEQITSFEIASENVDGSRLTGELIGNLYYGADCTSPLSTDEYTLSKLSIYPNPTKDLLTINTPSNLIIETVSIIDATGKKIKSTTTSKILGTSDLSDGFYIVKIKTSHGFVTKKIIKN